MAGTRISAIRGEVHAALVGKGWTPSAFSFAQLGRDKGGKADRSFATHAARIEGASRQRRSALIVETTLMVRAHIHVTKGGALAGSYDADDVAEALIDAVLFATLSAHIELDSLTITHVPAQHTVRVLTAAFTLRHQLYTQDVPS